MKLKTGMIVYCDTEEKAKMFLMECHKQGWKWNNGHTLVDNSGVKTHYNTYCKSTVYYLNGNTVQYGLISFASKDKLISFDDLPKTTEKKKCKVYTKHEYIHDNVKKVIVNEPCVIVILKSGEKGISKCHPDDVFNEKLGYEVAYKRAKIKELKKEIEGMEVVLDFLTR